VLPAAQPTGQHLKFREPQLQLRSTVARRSGSCAVKNATLLIAAENLSARSVEISARGHRYWPTHATSYSRAALPRPGPPSPPGRPARQRPRHPDPLHQVLPASCTGPAVLQTEGEASSTPPATLPPTPGNASSPTCSAPTPTPEPPAPMPDAPAPTALYRAMVRLTRSLPGDERGRSGGWDKPGASLVTAELLRPVSRSSAQPAVPVTTTGASAQLSAGLPFEQRFRHRDGGRGEPGLAVVDVPE
jgi:hypothetical protein